MKKKFLLIIAMLCPLHIDAANIVIQKTNQAQQSQDIATIGKWVFAGEVLQLFDKTGKLLASEPVNNIQHITFATTSSVEDIGTNTILVYPNPTHDILHIQGITAQPLRVFDTQGRLLQTENGTQISVSNLPTGTYLLQIRTQVVRFIKQ